jgi:hypothetical protein
MSIKWFSNYPRFFLSVVFISFLFSKRINSIVPNRMFKAGLRPGDFVPHFLILLLKVSEVMQFLAPRLNLVKHA